MMTKLTDDILDLSKMKAGVFELNPKPFELYQLVEDITYVFEGQCEQKGIGFKFNCTEEVSNQSFCTDINRLRQVLLNFISNAYKFTCLGSINVNMEFLNDEIPSPFKPRKLMF